MDIGLTDEEFQGLTLRLLFALLNRYEKNERRADLRTGLLASLYVNSKQKKGAKPLKPEDIYPEHGAKKRRLPARRSRRAPPEEE